MLELTIESLEGRRIRERLGSSAARSSSKIKSAKGGRDGMTQHIQNPDPFFNFLGRVVQYIQCVQVVIRQAEAWDMHVHGLNYG
jgi:hypothetical protein